MENRRDSMDGVGFVFSGGGGKGAYEIGVWRALDEYGVTPNVKAISGTSVGALNSALFAQGDFERAHNAWKTISPGSVMTLNGSLLYKKIASQMPMMFPSAMLLKIIAPIRNWINKLEAEQGLLSKKGLSDLIDGAIDLQHVLSFCGPIYIAAYDISSFQLKYFDLKQCTEMSQLKERLLASASIPVIFGKTYIDGDLYWDGGIPAVGDNTPVKPLYEAGYRNFVVVHLGREKPIDRKAFPDCNIIEIMPQQDLGGMVSGTMNFDSERAEENIQRGYDDAVRVLAPQFRAGMALNQMEKAFESIGREQRSFAEQKRSFDEKIEGGGKEIDRLLEDLDKGGHS